MSSIPLASNFLAGSLISLLFPTLLLTGLVLWYWFAVRRVPERERDSAAPVPGVAKPPPANVPTPPSDTPVGGT
jgi:hypothetical protein